MQSCVSYLLALAGSDSPERAAAGPQARKGRRGARCKTLLATILTKNDKCSSSFSCICHSWSRPSLADLPWAKQGSLTGFRSATHLMALLVYALLVYGVFNGSRHVQHYEAPANDAASNPAKSGRGLTQVTPARGIKWSCTSNRCTSYSCPKQQYRYTRGSFISTSTCDCLAKHR